MCKVICEKIIGRNGQINSFTGGIISVTQHTRENPEQNCDPNGYPRPLRWIFSGIGQPYAIIELLDQITIIAAGIVPKLADDQAVIHLKKFHRDASYRKIHIPARKPTGKEHIQDLGNRFSKRQQSKIPDLLLREYRQAKGHK